MKTYLNFDTKNLIKNINTSTEFYDVKSNKNNLYIIKKYKNKRGRNFFTILPEEIKISPEVVGLIVGDGFMNRSTFVFANSNREAINRVLEFLEQFNLPIKFYLEISVKNKPEEFINDCINFWEKNLNIKLKKIRLRKEFNSIIKYGTIHIILNNSLLAKLLKQIIEKSKKNIENSKNLSIDYLKGILAAEGNINVKNTTECVYMVRISASKKEEREHYKRCLEKIGIKIYCKDMPTISKQEAKEKNWKTTKGRAGAVIISKWDNFLNILLLDLLELHKEKEEKFNKYFINNKFTKQFLDFEYFINKRFTMKEAQNKFQFKSRQLDRVLTFLKKGYINRRKINKKIYYYKLTPKYMEAYNKLTPLLNSYS